MSTINKVFLSTLILSLVSCGGGGGGGGCNIAAGSVCPTGQYCAYFDNSCGAGGGSGSCTAIPTSCPATQQTVCSCDNLTFNNECFLSQAGQSIRNSGECA